MWMPSTAPGHRPWNALLPWLSLLLVYSAVLPAELGAEVTPDEKRLVDSWLAQHLPQLVATYEHIHAHPELSHEEKATAALASRELKAAGYSVQTGIGGHGVVGVLENGAGPVLLFRGDMDALPIAEETGLPYASTVTFERGPDDVVGVMHACGHDIHVASLLGSAQLLAALRDHWSGTLVMVAEPAEEVGRGALMMIEDGLFERVPRPTHTIALHVEPELPTGTVGFTSGWTGANVDSVDITVFGRGGHGARPHKSVDPVTTAAYLITQLQTLVSRRVDPLEPAVVTVGSIHGGHKHNVIPNDVHLQLTVRSYSDEVRELLIGGIRQLAEDTCRSFQCPAPPKIAVRENPTPAVFSDPKLVELAVQTFVSVLGDAQVVERKPSMGGDDFGRFSRHLQVPGILFRLGSVAPATYAASQKAGAAPLPSLHSSGYKPQASETLRTGIRSTVHLALELLDPR